MNGCDMFLCFHVFRHSLKETTMRKFELVPVHVEQQPHSIHVLMIDLSAVKPGDLGWCQTARVTIVLSA